MRGPSNFDKCWCLPPNTYSDTKTKKGRWEPCLGEVSYGAERVLRTLADVFRGLAVGVIMGFLYGTKFLTMYPIQDLIPDNTGSLTIMRLGAGPNGVMRTLGQYMLGSGAAFGYTHWTIPVSAAVHPELFLTFLIGSSCPSEA